MIETQAFAPEEVLSVVIPALNEELAIGNTLRRCIAARDVIKSLTGLKDVEFLVVSDGSTDRTEEIARSFADVTVLTFDVNRGYGAAIKCGFAHARGDLLGFLDADGTCDPEFFAELVSTVQRDGADVVLGSRMNAASRMPWIRTVGNRLFAWLLSALSMQSVMDTASGMRVLRRGALENLYPLPDGLHFTPAMSARALMEGKLKLVERPMPYFERTGRSKLSVMRDGVRFLSIIVRAAVTFRPARPLLMFAGLCTLLGVICALQPLVFYFQHHRLEEWVVYRVLLSSLIATVTGLVVCTAMVAGRIAEIAHGRWTTSKAALMLNAVFAPKPRTFCQVALLVAGLTVVAPGLVEYAETGHVLMHWSRAVLGSLLTVASGMLTLTGFLLRMMDYIESVKDTRSYVRPPERVRPRVSSIPPFASPATGSAELAPADLKSFVQSAAD